MLYFLFLLGIGLINWMFYTLFYLNSLTEIGRPTHFRKRKDTGLGLLDQYDVVGLVLNQIML